ncbi:MAG TPA: DMT family transporter [Terriglobales bacterium]|nr:DMT family transporter [Terriglobales bacterium]
MHTRAHIEKDGLLFAGITVLTWGLTGIFVRLLPGFPALFITGFRLLIALAAALPFVALNTQKRTAIFSMLRRPAAWMLASALVAYYVLAVSAYQFGPVGEVALFLGTSPVFVLAGRAIRGRKVLRGEKIGALIALCGVVLVLLPKLSIASGISRQRLLGDALALLSAAASAVYASTSRSVRQRDPQAADATLTALLGFAIGSALLVVSSVLSPTSVASVAETRVALIFIALGVVSTAIPSITYAVASQKLPPIISTTSQLMIPVVATIAAAFLLREMPSFWLLPGGALVLFGIIYMFRHGSQAAVVPPKSETDAVACVTGD